MDTRHTKQMEFVQGTEDKFADFIVANAKEGDAEDVVRAADTYCTQTAWMMNLGDVKGDIVDRVIQERRPATLLELGTYCGYSSTRFLGQMAEWGGKVTTVDPAAHTEVCERVWTHAGVRDRVEALKGTAESVIPSLKGKQFDMVFIDHAKDAYLPDLLLLEKHNIVGPGTWVVADNVLVFKLTKYLEHVKTGEFYDTEVHESLLEYTTDGTIDGVAVSKRK